jgi:predicted SAM-dependent methyltransferase
VNINGGIMDNLKINFGCGGNILEGWINCDSETDITRPLPYTNDCADFIFAEHVIEHIQHNEALAFLDECYRILKVNGVIRIAAPTISLFFKMNETDKLKYFEFTRTKTKNDAVRLLISSHGHKSVWTCDILRFFLNLAGFTWISQNNVGESNHKDLIGVEGHGKVIGDDINRLETIVYEGTKI